MRAAEKLDQTALCRASLSDDPTYRTYEEYAAADYNAWLRVTDEQPLKGLHATLSWAPYIDGSSGDCVKVIGFKREDGAGFTVPCKGGRWWVAWTHPMNRSAGWHHHALGSYASATAAAFAFDTVYEMERLLGNTGRCPDAVECAPT